jgi:MFS family permease
MVASGATPLWLTAAAITMAGLMRGVVSPSRDLLVRNAAPAGLLGTVMAVVTVGFTTGGSIMPVICGWLVDLGRGDAVFWLSAVMMLAAIGSVFIARERSL